jgi:outer membrane receptor protein involved in Fe transport
MNARKPWNRSFCLAALAAFGALPFAEAQTATAAPAPAEADTPVKLEKFIVTGSSIKRIADEGALPISVFTKLEM